MKRKLTSVVLAATMLSMSLSACSSQTKQVTEQTSAAEIKESEAMTEAASAVEDSGLKEGGKYKCSDEPLTLTAHIPLE